MTDDQPDPAAPAAQEPSTYEEARDALVETVRLLEAGGVSLEESLALWERGERLAQVCEERLEGARRRLDAVLEADAPAGDGPTA